VSIIYTCNLCGETIADDEPFVTLNGNGDRSENVWKTGWIGHYHARSTSDCWQRILDAIRAADGSGRRLEAIPTATYEQIASSRERHGVRLLLTDRAAAATAPPAAGDETLARLSPRTRSVLGAAGIDGPGGLRARLADGTLSALPGIGRKRLQEIRAALEPDPNSG
jgi:hypothetical protein